MVRYILNLVKVTIGRIRVQIAQFCRLTWFFLFFFFGYFTLYSLSIRTNFNVSTSYSLARTPIFILFSYNPKKNSPSPTSVWASSNPLFIRDRLPPRGLGPLYHIKRLLIQYKWTRASFINGFYQFKTRSWFTHTLPYKLLHITIMSLWFCLYHC